MVVFSGQELFQFPAIEVLVELVDGLGGFGFEAGVGFQFEEFGDRLYIPQLSAPSFVLFEGAGAIVEGLEDGLGGGLVIPKPRLAGLLL